MRTWWVLVLIVLMSSMAVEANIPPTRNGIKRNLPVYLRAGVITQEQADAVLGDVYQGNIENITIPKGTLAKNYFVVRKTGRLSSVSSWVAKYDRKARVVGGLTWLVPCDNLIILPKKPQPKVVVKKEKKEVVESTLYVVCSEEQAQPAQPCPVSQRVSLAPMQYSSPERPHLDVRNSQAPFGVWWKTRERVVERIVPPTPPQTCPPGVAPTPPPGNSSVFPQYPKTTRWWDPTPSNPNVADRVN